MHDRQIQFEWDEGKAAANARKHGVSFDLARTVFNDPLLLTVPDIDHSEAQERWFSIGLAVNGSMISVAHMWLEAEAATKVRIISARKATQTEIRQYKESL